MRCHDSASSRPCEPSRQPGQLQWGGDSALLHDAGGRSTMPIGPRIKLPHAPATRYDITVPANHMRGVGSAASAAAAATGPCTRHMSITNLPVGRSRRLCSQPNRAAQVQHRRRVTAAASSPYGVAGHPLLLPHNRTRPALQLPMALDCQRAGFAGKRVGNQPATGVVSCQPGNASGGVAGVGCQAVHACAHVNMQVMQVPHLHERPEVLWQAVQWGQPGGAQLVGDAQHRGSQAGELDVCSTRCRTTHHTAGP